MKKDSKGSNDKASEQSCPKPWLNVNGQMLTDAEIKTASASWAAEVWEQFLSETVDKPLKEVNHSQFAYERKLEEIEKSFWNDWNPTEEGDDKARLVRHLMRTHLAPQQRRILNALYVEDMSTRAIARRLGIAQKQVWAQKRNSLKKLKHLLENHTVTHRRYEGQNYLTASQQFPEMRPDIAEVYSEDLEGPIWCRGV